METAFYILIGVLALIFADLGLNYHARVRAARAWIESQDERRE